MISDSVCEVPEAPFLKSLFSTLKTEGVAYCVLRNYEHLPGSLAGSDLDLLVRVEDRDRIADLIISVAADCGGKIIAEYATTGRFIKLLGCHDGVWWGCAVDLLAGVDYRGMVYVSSDGVLERAGDYREIPVANEADVEVMALLKELVNNGKTRRDYFSNASRSYKSLGKVTLEILRETFSDSLVERFATILESGIEDAQELSNLAKKMRGEIWRVHGVKQIGSICCNFCCRLSRLFSPPGISMAVTGTDGSGKTTVINAMSPVLERAIHGEINYQHLRPNWLRALGVATHYRESDDGAAVVNPHGKKPSGSVGSILRLAYYAVDYMAGYWIKIYPMLVKRVNVCLFDRYFYDIILDPRRMRMSLPKWVLSSVFRLAPQPQLVLCLGGDPELIYARKPETSLDDVKRQVEALQVLAKSNKRAVWVDTGVDKKESVDQALRAVLEHASKRYIGK